MASDREKADKSKMNQVKHVPKDAQVIMSIMKEMNVPDYEPRVVNQLLEFTYRYVTCVLDDAKVFANHARKKTIELDDVQMATQAVLDKSFTCPPPRHVLSKLAEVRNSMPLPPIKPHCGLRLPPDRYCLSACNYKLRASNQPRKMVKSALDSRSGIKTQLKPITMSPNVGGGAVKRTVLPPKNQIVQIPKPVIKFTTTTKITPIDTKSTLSGDDMKMEVDHIPHHSSGGVKRERDEDDFEMVP